MAGPGAGGRRTGFRGACGARARPVPGRGALPGRGARWPGGPRDPPGAHAQRVEATRSSGFGERVAQCLTRRSRTMAVWSRKAPLTLPRAFSLAVGVWPSAEGGVAEHDVAAPHQPGRVAARDVHALAARCPACRAGCGTRGCRLRFLALSAASRSPGWAVRRCRSSPRTSFCVDIGGPQHTAAVLTRRSVLGELAGRRLPAVLGHVGLDPGERRARQGSPSW